MGGKRFPFYLTSCSVNEKVKINQSFLQDERVKGETY